MKLHIKEASKKLDKFYYDTVKNIISKTCGIPKGQLEEVSSRDRDEWGFKNGYVTIIISPWDRTNKKDANVNKFIQNLDNVKKAFNNNCEIIKVPDFDTYSIVVSQECIDNISIDNSNNTSKESDIPDTISFWATTVFDTRTTAVAYGAKIKCADGWSFPGSLSRIQQRLGERRFYYFSKGTNKSFKSYNALVKFLKDIDTYIEVPSEEDIITAGYDERYFTH